ncbi:interleukin-8-like [Paramormyrops kingsleyae]|uniref:interleukin-8-like n=1 Tax=Paramormyrops kingsleyae TaxID=1676925 RepID=UPI003B96C9DB
MHIRTLLLFSVLVSVALAQIAGFGKSRCLCRRVRDKSGPPKNILDIQIYPPTPSCDTMEVVVSLKNGLQYCLDPRLQKVQDIISTLKSVRAQLKETSTPEP